jgi:hypothetical protein
VRERRATRRPPHDAADRSTTSHPLDAAPLTHPAHPRAITPQEPPWLTNLRAAVGAAVYADILDAPIGQGFDANGTHVRGIEVVESTRLAADEIIVFIPEAFTLVARAPIVPSGAAHGASVRTPLTDDKRGAQFAVRVINDYDSNVAADRSLVSSFIKVASMPLPVDNEDGTVTLHENGGVVRVLTAA